MMPLKKLKQGALIASVAAGLVGATEASSNDIRVIAFETAAICVKDQPSCRSNSRPTSPRLQFAGSCERYCEIAYDHCLNVGAPNCQPKYQACLNAC